MHRLACVTLAAVLAATAPGCITTYGAYKHQQNVTTANIVTAGALDLGVGTFLLFSAEARTLPVAFLSSLAITAVDLGVACILGTCQVLHP